MIKIMYNQSFQIENLVNAFTDRSMNMVKMKNEFTGKTKVVNSPLYRALWLWDTLPTDIQKEPDKNVLKKEIS